MKLEARYLREAKPLRLRKTVIVVYLVRDEEHTPIYSRRVLVGPWFEKRADRVTRRAIDKAHRLLKLWGDVKLNVPDPKKEVDSSTEIKQD